MTDHRAPFEIPNRGNVQAITADWGHTCVLGRDGTVSSVGAPTTTRAYASQAQADGPSKYMTDLNNGITEGFDWFQVTGGRQDYMTHYHGTREVTIEHYRKYLVNGNELDRLWRANNTAILAYIENALTGVRGIVTNRRGEPLAATVKILEIPTVGAEIATDPAVGDYHRMLVPGTYHLRIESPGYAAVEPSVTVNAGAATRLDVVMK